MIWKDQIILLSAIQTDQKIDPDKTGEQEQKQDWMNPRSTDYIHKFVVISVDRDEISSWSAPAVIEHEGSVQLITNASVRIRPIPPVRLLCMVNCNS